MKNPLSVSSVSSVVQFLPASNRYLLLALLAGVALVLAFAPFGIFPLAVLSLALLFWLWQNLSPRTAFITGWWFGVGLFGGGCWWIFISLNTFGHAPLWVSVPIMLGLVAILACYPGLVGYATARWLPPSGLLRYLVGLPALWTLSEWLRSWVLSGFPWLSVGYSQSDSMLAGYAPVFGVFGMSLLVAVCAGILAALVFTGWRVRIVLAVGFVAIWVTGAGLRQADWTAPAGTPIQVALVQGNIPQQLKWQPEVLAQTEARYRKLIATHWQADLIVWPEAAIPALYHQVAVDYLTPLDTERRQHGAALLLGILDYNPAQNGYYNTVLKLGTEPVFYRKRHLVPFGEYFPVPDFIRQWLRLMNLPYADFTSGANQQALLQANGISLGVSICYEIIFGAEIIRDLPAAELLVNVSNDAWFGESIGPHQHFQIARLRAMETGRYLLRATNTGITAIVRPDGTVANRLPQFEAGVLVGQAVPYGGATPYVRWGNWPVVLFAGALAVAAGVCRRWLQKR